MNTIFYKIFRIINTNKKSQIILLVAWMVLSSFAELISIAIFIPFISILLGNAALEGNKIYEIFNSIFGNNLLLSMIVITILTTIIACFVRLLSIKWSINTAADISNELVYKAYYSLLNKDFNYLLQQDKSKLISTIHTNGNISFIDGIHPILTFLDSICFTSIIGISLLIFNWKALLIVSSFLLIIYKFYTVRTKKILDIESRKQVELNTESINRLEVELNSIEYIQLGNLQKQCSSNYRKIDKELKSSWSNYMISARYPRVFIEYLCLLALICISLILFIKGDIQKTLPILAASGLLAQKLFPIIQKSFESWATLRNTKESLETLLDLIEPIDKSYSTKTFDLKKIDFSEIKFNNVSFSYVNSSEILQNINLNIKKGERIAIMGISGSGKSTLMRLICGLLVPSEGEILVNKNIINKTKNIKHTLNWMRSIGYVPQKINLTGKTLRENITFGDQDNSEPDLSIEEIIKITCLEELVKRCDGLDKEIFQSSFLLSGGENQRLAIARAIYKNPKFLLMDEPTSALDSKTQAKIFKNIFKMKNITCVVITHRLENKELFDKVITIEKGDLIEI